MNSIWLLIQGIWVGMLLGTLVQTIVLLFITSRTDWDKQVISFAQQSDDHNMEKIVTYSRIHIIDLLRNQRAGGIFIYGFCSNIVSGGGSSGEIE
jgi:hypothetical protein